MGAVEGWVVTHDGETIRTGFSNDSEAVGWLHKRHSFSVDHAVRHEGYDIVRIENGKVTYSYRQESLKRERPGMGADSPKRVFDRNMVEILPGQKVRAHWPYYYINVREDEGIVRSLDRYGGVTIDTDHPVPHVDRNGSHVHDEPWFYFPASYNYEKNEYVADSTVGDPFEHGATPTWIEVLSPASNGNKPSMGNRKPREGEEGTAYIDKSGGRWTARWWSKDENRYYSLPPKSTREAAVSAARKQGFKPVVAEPHAMGNLKTMSEHPVPLWPEFVDAYLAAALWASAAKDEEQLDAKYTIEDFTQEAVDRAVQDSNDFIRQNRLLLNQASPNKVQHGHDFFLTRNLHGAGFRDHDYGPIGDRLANAAHAFGPINAYADTDEKVRFE